MRYERGEHRYKHRWAKDYAGFEPGRRGHVGKCPKSITDSVAEAVLNNRGIPVFDTDDREEDAALPDRLYAVYDGVVYEAKPTLRGVSYHAYPWRGDIKKKPMARWIKRKLHEQVAGTAEETAFKDWMKKYDGRS